MERSDEILSYWEKIIAESDRVAFEKFFYLLNGKLTGFCRQFVAEHDTAEEIVTDVFIKFWSNRSTLRHVNNPEVFMLVSVKNAALNYQRRSPRLKLVSISDETPELIEPLQPDTELERKELILQLDQAIASLPHQCRLIFKLVKEDGMRCGEVAEILDISVRTVHAQLYRAVNKLNVSLAECRPASRGAVVRHIASVKVI